MWDAQSRDIREEWRYFLQQHNEDPDQEIWMDELQTENMNFSAKKRLNRLPGLTTPADSDAIFERERCCVTNNCTCSNNICLFVKTPLLQTAGGKNPFQMEVPTISSLLPQLIIHSKYFPDSDWPKVHA